MIHVGSDKVIQDVISIKKQFERNKFEKFGLPPKFEVKITSCGCNFWKGSNIALRK